MGLCWNWIFCLQLLVWLMHIAIVGLDFLVDFVYCILIFKLLSLFE